MLEQKYFEEIRKRLKLKHISNIVKVNRASAFKKIVVSKRWKFIIILQSTFD